MNQFNKANTDQNLLNCIYGYYVKYDRLAQLINQAFAGSDAETIDIYIDFYNIACRVFNYMKTPGVSPYQNPLFLTTGVINMCAHYREFFRRYYKTNARFWIIDASDISAHTRLYKEYKHAAELSEYDKAAYINNIEILNTLCPFLPDIQLVTSNGFDFNIQVASISKWESEHGNSNPNLIISKDVLTYLASASIPNTFVLRPKKTADGDVSTLIHHNCIGDYFHDINHSTSVDKTFLNQYMSFILACTRVPTRNLKNRGRLDTVLAACHRIIENRYLIQPYEMIAFNEAFDRSNLTIDKFEAELRWKVIDIYHMMMVFNMSGANSLYNGIVNLYDPESVKKINETYFAYLPLDLEVL